MKKNIRILHQYIRDTILDLILSRYNYYSLKHICGLNGYLYYLDSNFQPYPCPFVCLWHWRSRSRRSATRNDRINYHFQQRDWKHGAGAEIYFACLWILNLLRNALNWKRYMLYVCEKSEKTYIKGNVTQSKLFNIISTWN